MIGQTRGRYLIEAALGEGGMGVVYRARDTLLRRTVALKVLHQQSGDAEAGARLLREARAASALSHPNICAVFEIGDPDGESFIVMEYVEGEPLDRLSAEAVSPKQVAQFGRQIADAMAHAHDRGVVHRDLKGANVILQANGQLKVLDFGVAIRLARPGDLTASETVAVTPAMAGTLACMAPEVLAGEPPDSRSDLWSLGVLLYRLTSGRMPFDGHTAFELTAAILHQPAPPLPSGVPASLAAVITRCLAKHPGDRFARASEVGAALDVVIASALEREPPLPKKKRAAAARKIRSLVVLPLDNLSKDPDQEYFADGMTEAIIADLAQIAALRVTSRTSAWRYKSDRPPVADIVSALDVDAVVEGSIRVVGDRVRVTVRLVHGLSDSQVWAGNYDGGMDDVLGLQSTLATAIAREIRVTLTPRERGRLALARRVDPDAHLAYLKGRDHLSRGTGQDMQEARTFFELAIAKDPACAPAHAGLGDANLTMAVFGLMPPRQGCPVALQSAARAIVLDPDLAEGHRVQAFATMLYEWDWRASEAAFGKALALAPGSALCHWSFAICLSAMERFDEAISHARRAVLIDPLALGVNNDLACIFWFARRNAEAIEHYRKTLELDPHFVMARRELGLVLAQEGRHAEAIELLRSALPLSEDAEALTYLGVAHAMAGQMDEAGAILAELRARARVRYVTPVNIAALLTHLGEHDEALALLDQACQERSPMFMFLKVHSILDPLRGDPRFQALQDRLTLP